MLCKPRGRGPHPLTRPLPDCASRSTAFWRSGFVGCACFLPARSVPPSTQKRLYVALTYLARCLDRAGVIRRQSSIGRLREPRRQDYGDSVCPRARKSPTGLPRPRVPNAPPKTPMDWDPARTHRPESPGLQRDFLFLQAIGLSVVLPTRSLSNADGLGYARSRTEPKRSARLGLSTDRAGSRSWFFIQKAGFLSTWHGCLCNPPRLRKSFGSACLTAVV